MTKNRESVSAARRRQDRLFKAAIGLEASLRLLIDQQTPTAIQRFQQLVQFAPASLKSRMLDYLEKRTNERV